MGGNAFKHCVTKRKVRAEYLELESSVIKIVKYFFTIISSFL